VGIWDTSRKLLASSVVNHLGEDLTLTEANDGDGEATLRGVLTRPEEFARLGLSQVIAGDARLTLRKTDAPAWLDRGVTVTSERAETFRVTAVHDNGEGLLEVILCRSS
jgi:hypothetical protein